MKVYWSISHIPEFAHLTEAQQKVAFQECYKRYLFKLRATWLACAIMFILVATGMHVFGPVLGATIGGVIGSFILGIIITNALRPHLKQYVAHHFVK